MKHRQTCTRALLLLCFEAFPSLGQAPPTNLPLPQTMRLCAYNCFTLQLNGAHYDAFSDDAAHKLISNYTVVHFTPDSVEMNRADLGGDTAVLTGKMSPGNEAVTGGKMKWSKTGGTISFQLTWGDSIAKATKQAPPPAVRRGPPPSCSEVIEAEQKKHLDVSKEVEREFALREPTGKHAADHYNLTGQWLLKECIGTGYDTRAFEYTISQHDEAVKMTLDTPGLPISGQVVFAGMYSESQKILGMGGFNSASSPEHVVMGDQVITVETPDTLRLAGSNAELIRLSVPGIDDAPCNWQKDSHVFPIYAQLRAREAIVFRNDYAKAACWYTTVAQRGDSVSQGMLSLLFYLGLGVEKDYSKAFSLAQFSAKQGSPLGQSDLALMYATGHGVERNQAISSYWFEAARTTPMGVANLSWKPKMLYGITPETPVEETGALPPLLLPDGMSQYATMTPELECSPEHAKGLSGSELWSRSQMTFAAKQVTHAVCWAFRSAQLGNMDAIHMLAWAFDRGMGVEHRNQAAVFWAIRLAERGDLYGQARLAVLYRQGIEVPKNPAQAERWTKAAMAQPGGKELMDLFEHEELSIAGTYNLDGGFYYSGGDDTSSCNRSRGFSRDNCVADLRRKAKEDEEAEHSRWEMERLESKLPVSIDEEEKIEIYLIRQAFALQK